MVTKDLEKSNTLIDIVDGKVKLNQQDELTEEQKVIVKGYLRKIDVRILPVVIVLYIFSLIDRGNIGAALVSGLRENLKLNSTQEGNSTTMFYIFYLLFETPANMLLKKVRPHFWFGLIGLLWGLSCTLLAFAKTPTLFIVLRGFLGAFEAGLTPGVVAYLHYWYTRSEVAYRMTIFFLAVPISGCIGGPLSAALSKQNLGFFKPYQAIFLIEGLLTTAVSIITFFVLIDYPDEAKFFNPEERELVLKRLNTEQGMASQVSVSFRETLMILTDWKIYVNAVIFFGMTNIHSIKGLFTPTLLKAAGYNYTTAIYLGSFSYAFGVIGVLLSIRFVNRINFYLLISAFASITVITYGIAAFSTGKIMRFVFISIAGFGASPTIPLTLTWSSINQGGVYKGLISSAVVISMGSASGIIVPRFFVANYGPEYTLGHAITIGSACLTILLSVLMSIYLRIENKRRDNNPVDISHISIEEQRLLNDKHPSFRYKL
ncbi:hypothetical protein BB561_006222 [Smittium simulii]|uniref:Major facilitator superfamily (MFS) profile domain-containing protein n=1 Tax=Smittium simulii TaxID=133385 RepID=A0A2T9Y5U3_9FUNG|nr:hypothetical protein BB561_006222 [Smittium simulii]